MSEYITKQRKMLIDFLNFNTDKRFTAEEIAENLSSKGISLSAVYRNISHLEAEGKIKRFSVCGSRKVFYQYVASKHCHNSIHLSCKKCGKSFHMNSDDASSLVNSTVKNEGFAIDISDTVLYGICRACQKA